MHTTRRDMLLLGAGGAALAAGSAAFPGRADAQIARVRRQASPTDPNDPTLLVYGNAVNYMRSLPSSDRRSWAYQTNIHYNYCPHGNWYFLPWHREYLRAFEDIIRSLTAVAGASTFALPYWDWTASPRLPAAFTSPTLSDGVTANPLYDSTRQVGAGSTIPTELTGPAVMGNVYAQTRFESFASSRPSGQTSTSSSWQRRTGTYGPLEGTPHNSVHNWIGGNMSTMLSPTDPIFWLHHGNIDRIWASWNAQGNANTTDSLWRDFTFGNNFARTDGTLYSVQVKNVSMAAYSYDRLDPRPAAARAASLLPEGEWFQVAALGAAPPVGKMKGLFRVPNGKGAALGRPASIPIPLGGEGPQLSPDAALRLLDIPAPPVANAPFVRVFVNHPAIAPDTPPEGPYYVGTVAFFGTATQHAAMHMAGGIPTFSFELPLTRALAQQRAIGKDLGDALTVQIVPVTLGATVQQVVITPAALEAEFF
jgi:tyrosinase